MIAKKNISIIIPALKNDSQYKRCVFSIEAAFDGKSFSFEILVVTPNPNDFQGSSRHVKVFKENHSGIYNAMNQGISSAIGEYIYFMGQDDIMLPSFCDALALCEDDCDIVVSDVFFGSKRMYRNKVSKLFLVLKNWCHQGVIYNKDSFKVNAGFYKGLYKSQADHYANILMMSGSRRARHYSGCIAWYSADGFSTVYRDEKFRKVFPVLILKKFGLIYFLVVSVRRWLLHSHNIVLGFFR